MWAYATMGMAPVELALWALEAGMEEVARESNSEDVANTSWTYATMRALDARAVVLTTDVGVREDTLYVGGKYQNKGISLLDRVCGGGTSIPNHADSVYLAQLDARVDLGGDDDYLAQLEVRVEKAMMECCAYISGTPT